jgi:hypothetical protein
MAASQRRTWLYISFYSQVLRWPPLLRGHGDSQTIVLFPFKTLPHHFHHQKVLCNEHNNNICIALEIINTPINQSSSLIE